MAICGSELQKLFQNTQLIKKLIKTKSQIWWALTQNGCEWAIFE